MPPYPTDYAHKDGGGNVRVLHVQETLSPSHGGPARVLRELVCAQEAAGHRVEVVTTNAAQPHEPCREPGWDRIEGCSARVYYGAIQFSPLKVSVGLASYLRRTIPTFHIVHIHGLYRFPPAYAAYQARKQRVPYIIRPHGSLDPYLYDKSTVGSVALKRLHERWFDLPNLHGASAIHFTAEEERKRVAFLQLRAPSFVVPNGLDWEPYRVLPARGAMRARWGLGEVPLVLFLGRIHFKKGLDLLISAFDVLRRRVPGACLVIAGPENDDYGKNVRRWVRERRLEHAVHFVGHLSGADVVRAYVDADAFVLPSYTENFGIAVIEAMASAVPVVISDRVNIHREVARAGAGVVTRCDADEVAEALETVLCDVDRRKIMGEVGRRLVQQRYSWPEVVNALTREYERIVERHRARRKQIVRRDVRA